MPNGIRTRTLSWVTAVWSAAVSAVLVWQTVRYEGLIGWLAEWQFRNFERFFPVATIVVLTVLLSLPFVILIFLRLRKSFKHGAKKPHSELIAGSRIAATFLTTGIIGTGSIATILFAMGLAQGRVTEKPVPVKLEQIANHGVNTMAVASKIKVQGTILYNRAGYYRERFLFTSRELWVAPLVSDTQSKQFTTFAEIAPSDASEAKSGEIAGYLKAGGVPGGLAQLYLNSGYSVTSGPNLIYSDLRSARWPYWSAAGDLAFLLLLLTGVAIFHNRYRKSLAAQIT